MSAPSFLRRLRNLFRKNSVDRDMAEQIEHHLELMTEENIMLGLPPAAARAAALKKFGGVEQLKEQCREERTFPFLENLVQDLSYGLRQLRHAPGFALATILTFALGIGATTALYTIAHRVVLHPLNYRDPDRIVRIWSKTPKFPQIPTSPGTFHEWSRQARSFAFLASQNNGSVSLPDGDRKVQVSSVVVTSQIFDVYQIKAELGRLFTEQDMKEGAPKVTILSHLLWLSRFGGRANVIGETIRLNDQVYTIIGVVEDPQLTSGQFILPSYDESKINQFAYAEPGFWPVARLKPGVTLEAAQAEMELIATRLAQTHPETNRDMGVTLLLERDLWIGEIRPQMYVLLAAVGLLLLLACANVANLLMARANSRTKEFALRGALGAGRGRLIRQLLSESVLIAVIGGGLGILFAYAAMGPLIQLASHFMPNTSRIALDGRILFVMTSVMLACGVGFGLFPALQATRGDLIDSIKDGSGRSASAGAAGGRLRSALIVAEVSLALVLLAGTGLMIRTLRAMQVFDQGVRVENVSTDKLLLPANGHFDSKEKILTFTRTALEKVQHLPGILHASFANWVPMDPAWQRAGFILEGEAMPKSPGELHSLADAWVVTPDYFSVMSIPLLRGRTISAQDTKGAAPVVVINQEFADKYFPNQNPIGRHLRVFSEWEHPETEWPEIVGVVGNVKPRGPTSPTSPQVYRSFDQYPKSPVSLVIRTNGPQPGVSPAIGEILHSLDADVPYDHMWDYQLTIEYAWVAQRFNMIVFLLFAAAALLLATVGIYGVMAYSVLQRTQEMAIRMALGALPRDIIRHVLAQGARLVALGLLLGTAVAIASTRLLASLLFNTSPSDPLTFLVILAVLSFAAFLACLIPARRIARTNPLEALRSQ